jgi:antitoxin component of RelBE/YafQ-DinJ toxin-antitoxin module
MGLPLSTLVNNYLKTFIIEQKVTFTAPMPNKKTIRAIESARRDIKAGKNLYGPFISVKDAINSLNT